MIVVDRDKAIKEAKEYEQFCYDVYWLKCCDGNEVSRNIAKNQWHRSLNSLTFLLKDNE